MMMHPSLLLCGLCFALFLSFIQGFHVLPSTPATSFLVRSSVQQAKQQSSTLTLQMGLFDFLAPKKTATASHILIKGPEGPKKLTELKEKIVKSADVKQAFAAAAAEYSACPSASRGGALGTFKQGQMVPAFDKVVFTEKVGEVHGPINTMFGAHLILIEDRQD